LTHEIFIEILNDYERTLQSKIEEFVSKAKELLGKKDKEGTSQYIERKKVFETEMQNIPKDQVKQVPLESLPDVYDRLKDHMKVFGVNIDELNPLKKEKTNSTPEKVPTQTTKLTHDIFIEILNKYEKILQKKIEEDTAMAKDLLVKKDKEGISFKHSS
jgi:hypothetical protein